MTENRAPLNRRRQYFVKRPFQTKFILQFLSLAALGSITFGLAVYLYSTQTLTTAFIDSKLRVMKTSDFLLPSLVLIGLIVTALVALLAAFRMLFFSHKIAGPLYRLEKTAQTVGNGNLNLEVRLRSDDELQDFARSMDGMVRDLRTRALVIKNQTLRLREIIQEGDKIPSIPRNLLESLKETQHQLEEAAGNFQV